MAVVWIVNQYHIPASQTPNSRHSAFAKLLSSRGHDVTIISADDHHHLREKEDFGSARDEGYSSYHITVPRYNSAHDKRRVLAWFVFAWRLCFVASKLNNTPDVILVSSPSLISFLGAERLARKTGARLVFEVRDIWPLTLTSIGNISKRHPFIRFLAWVERRALAKSDRVITTMPGGIDYVKSLGVDEHHARWIPNALDNAFFADQSKQREKSAASRNKLLVAYTGTLGLANSVETILDAAEVLKVDSSIGFVIMGEGRLEEELRARVAEQGLSNVEFLPFGDDEAVNALLASVDAGLLCWRDSDLYEFGTSAMKMPRYLAAGKPVIQAYSGKYDQVTINNAGITVPAEDGQALADAIRSFQALSASEKKAMATNAIEAAKTLYSSEAQLTALEKVLFH